ncbi:4-hydroxyacetophenone monooxygenase [Nannizzia gypsea CBS 118893]|uniref:4-hydroxyacetophenone monooxygenase n=1 Tax=Arthroderma gypseum (strain ATCC MYA-4604 / CBS 118893) TaxID=535722 RepID=E4UR81_ARTGP|nr:4-hydroxyacetophenone monooxygenase [Nannizzia gypsea CBS 118893]EFQ99356.1 4-hydroxyacetophenone monooxygenase [Nannizzia gypsea CBS 118893]
MASKVAWQAPAGNKGFTDTGIVIIGGGISGMCMAISLLKNNIRNFVILEKSAGLGGTWKDNKYPGCCCDVFSHLYSFSFAQNPDWTRLYPSQEEILNYLNDVGDKHGLHRYIRFSSMVEECRWNEDEKKWKTTVHVEGAKDSEFGERYTISSDFLLSAVGQLNYPHYPSIPGIDDFKGKLMHSARWDWSYSIKGKKVGIIGNGATAAQIIPEIAPEVSHLTVFQRTPNWVAPRYDMSMTLPIRFMFRYIPGVLSKFRAIIMDVRESLFTSILKPESQINGYLKKINANMMKRQLANKPELWEKLTPNYPPGCKRIITSDDYYPALARENVSLETGHIDRISESGIVVDGTEQQFDLIILATGFRTVEFMHPIKVYGENGRSLSDIWKGGARGLYGITIESLPNFAMLYGPNTNLGHSSIILMVEAQTRYIMSLLTTVLRSKKRGKALTITPKVDRIDEFNESLQKDLAKSSFAHPNCTSWYKNDEGLITNNWSSNVLDYQKLLSRVDWTDFDMEGDDFVKGKTYTRIGRVREESLVGIRTLSAATIAAAVIYTVFRRSPDFFPGLLRSLNLS